MSSTEIENLQRKVRQSIFYAAGLVLVVISLFMIKVWLLSDNQLSSNAEKWGQFGDYVGGILNPLMAFLAFYWLTQSVLIQKQELMDTKKALQESSQAQLKQTRKSDTQNVGRMPARAIRHSQATHQIQKTFPRKNRQYFTSEPVSGSLAERLAASALRVFNPPYGFTLPTYGRVINKINKPISSSS